MGFDWRLMVALITSFPAKENAIATLGVIFGSTPGASLAQSLTSTFSTASGLSFLVVYDAFHHLHGNCCGHSPGNELMGLDAAQHRLVPGHLDRGGHGGLSSFASRWTLDMLEDSSRNPRWRHTRNESFGCAPWSNSSTDRGHARAFAA